MDGNTVLLLIALMILVGVVLVNVVIAGVVLRLEGYRVAERDKSNAAAPPNAPRAANVYVAALLVSGVPLVAFFSALLGTFSAGGWAYVAAGAATVGAIVGAVTLCAAPSSASESDAPAPEMASATDEPPTLSVVTIEDESAADTGDDEREERRTPDDANG